MDVLPVVVGDSCELRLYSGQDGNKRGMDEGLLENIHRLCGQIDFVPFSVAAGSIHETGRLGRRKRLL